jgi:riboflavin synthase
MFTGIIETKARVEKIEGEGSNLNFTLSSDITGELKIDQSLAHDGVCLTVVEINGKNYKVTAIAETLNRTNLKELKAGSEVNIERCMPATGRFDGHIVQGHVDTVAVCKTKRDLNGSWEFIFEFPAKSEHPVVEKGSVTINGVSLTVVNCDHYWFSVHIIPYTMEHTNFKNIREGTKVNIEFDIVGKYVAKLLNK